MKKRKILFGMIIVNFISMLSGFVRDSSIAATLGSTTLADIFMFIINLPTMIFSSLGWVIMSTFLPAYTDVMVNQETKKLNEFSNTFIKCIMMIVALIMIVLLIFKKAAIGIMAPGFVSENYKLTEELFIIVLPSLIFLSISSCLVAILNANKKMVWVAGMGIPVNIMTIISILIFYPRYGVHFSIGIVVVGSILQLLIFLYPLSRTSFRFNLAFNLRDQNIKNILRSIGPMLIGVMAQQINSMFGSSITSTLSAGSLISYNLANKVVNAIYNSIILIGISYIFPYMAQYYASKEFDKFKDNVIKGINLMVLILIPITVLIIILNHEIIEVLYGYGKFDSEAITITGKILLLSGLGIIFLGIKELLNRAYYAAQNTLIPMKYSVIGIAINVIMALILCRKIEVLGVALASTLSTFISCIMLYHKFKKQFELRLLVKKNILKYFIIFILLYVIGGFINNQLSIENVMLASVFNGLVVCVLYIILLLIFKVDIRMYFNIKKQQQAGKGALR